jgi:hypothetical protein
MDFGWVHEREAHATESLDGGDADRDGDVKRGRNQTQVLLVESPITSV